MTLLGDDDRPVARGVVPVDEAEGVPPAIFWRGELYLRQPDAMSYRKGRAMFADAAFQAVR